MTELLLHVELSKDSDLDYAAKTVQDRLSKLVMVKAIEAKPETTRLTGMEVAASIAVAVVIVRSSRELIIELRSFIKEFKKLVADIQGFKSVSVEIGGQRISLEQPLSDEQLSQLMK